jgi:hypothetical protein
VNINPNVALTFVPESLRLHVVHVGGFSDKAMQHTQTVQGIIKYWPNMGFNRRN